MHYFNIVLTTAPGAGEGQVTLWASQVVLVVKNLLANAGDVKDVGLIPGLGRSPGEGNGNPLQYSCLENPMDGGAWWATVHGVAKSQTRLINFTLVGLPCIHSSP